MPPAFEIACPLACPIRESGIRLMSWANTGCPEKKVLLFMSDVLGCGKLKTKTRKEAQSLLFKIIKVFPGQQ
jgi:hypothetical protein